MPFIENFLEFKKRQNCPSIFRDETNEVWFENGAWSDGRVLHREPPEDAVELLRARLKYTSLLLDQKQHLFEQCRTYITIQSQYHRMGVGGPAVPQAFDDLAKFQTEIRDIEADMSVMRGEIKRLCKREKSWDEYVEKRDVERSKADADIRKMQSILDDAHRVELEEAEQRAAEEAAELQGMMDGAALVEAFNESRRPKDFRK